MFSLVSSCTVLREGVGLVLRQLGGLDHTHDLGHLLPVHLVLEHHAGHTGVVGNDSLGRGLGRPEIVDQYLSRR